jgi:hypothetical protein
VNRLLVIFVVVAVGLVAGLGYVAREVWSSRAGVVSEENLLANPAGMADRVDFVESAGAWSLGKMERVAVAGDRVVLRDSRGQFPREGTWTGPQVQTAFAFTELLPSYNPSCPSETGVRLDVRVRDAKAGRWSSWLYLGSWGKTIGKEKRVTRDDSLGGAVHIDYLTLGRPADAYQARLTFYSLALDESVNPAVRRVAVCYSGITGKADRIERGGGANSPGTWARDLRVPFRAQGVEYKSIKGEICSPTSVSMVMQHWGFDRATAENALAIYDAEYDLFGNWGRAVAWAGQNGFDAYLRRFRNFEQVKESIAAGQPIVASIRFKEGECPSFVMKKTAGHLIVIRGMTAAGDLIVNDPASKEKGDGVVYRAEDVRRAWLDHGGVGYVIRPAVR